MIIIGCDFHTRYQQIAMAREETGEVLVERMSASTLCREIKDRRLLMSRRFNRITKVRVPEPGKEKLRLLQ